jgi:hypothetical protein
MKKFICLMLASCLVGCTQEPPPTPVEIVNTKFCIQVCTDHEFRKFHANGESWGTGSSSMNGVSESKIYEKVRQQCIEFYKEETCCLVKHHTGFSKIFQIHSYNYGACR